VVYVLEKKKRGNDFKLRRLALVRKKRRRRNAGGKKYLQRGEPQNGQTGKRRGGIFAKGGPEGTGVGGGKVSWRKNQKKKNLLKTGGLVLTKGREEKGTNYGELRRKSRAPKLGGTEKTATGILGRNAAPPQAENPRMRRIR